MKQIIEALSGCEVFRSLPAEKIISILARHHYEMIEYHRKDLIVRASEPYPFFSVVVSGTIEIHRPLSSGDSIFLEERSTGGAIGGSTVLAPEGTAAECDVLASSEAGLFRLSSEEFRRMLSENPDVACRVNELFAERVIRLHKRIEIMSYSSIKRKIAYYCLNAASVPDCDKLTLPFSKTKWAEYLNISRPSLMRDLKKLESDGIVRVDNLEIRITDRERLEEFL